MKLSQEWVTKVTSATTEDEVSVMGRPKMKITHHLSSLVRQGPLQMITLIPVNPDQDLLVVTVPVEEINKIFASVGGRSVSSRKAAAARLNGRKGGRPKK